MSQVERKLTENVAVHHQSAETDTLIDGDRDGDQFVGAEVQPVEVRDGGEYPVRDSFQDQSREIENCQLVAVPETLPRVEMTLAGHSQRPEGQCEPLLAQLESLLYRHHDSLEQQEPSDLPVRPYRAIEVISHVNK